MKVIINADDFGLSKTKSLAIIEALEKGLVSTTTVMSNEGWFDNAMVLAYKKGYIDRVGLHINLTHGIPLTKGIRNNCCFCDKEGRFHGKINRLFYLSKKSRQDIYNEVDAQIIQFCKWGGRCEHVDSHHHIHTAPFIFLTILPLLKKYNVRYVRIANNTCKSSLIKRVYKYLFNIILSHCGFTSAQYLCDFKTIDCIPSDAESYEIETHPDYNNNGDLKNRFIDELDDLKKIEQKLSTCNDFYSDNEK